MFSACLPEHVRSHQGVAEEALLLEPRWRGISHFSVRSHLSGVTESKPETQVWKLCLPLATSVLARERPRALTQCPWVNVLTNSTPFSLLLCNHQSVQSPKTVRREGEGGSASQRGLVGLQFLCLHFSTLSGFCTQAWRVLQGAGPGI